MYIIPPFSSPNSHLPNKLNSSYLPLPLHSKLHFTMTTAPTPTSPPHLILILSCIAVAFLWGGLVKADPEPLQDYCIADRKGSEKENMFINGVACINPELAKVSHFTTSALSKPGNATAKPFGFSITVTNSVNLPGINTMGLTMGRVDIKPNGCVPLHSHPRASEVATLLKGSVLVGFIDTSNRLFTQQLRVGDSFVFPKGMMHFLHNLERSGSALVLSGLNSQNPGTQITSMAAFATKPPLPDEVLQIAFQINGQDIARIRRNLGG